MTEGTAAFLVKEINLHTAIQRIYHRGLIIHRKGVAVTQLLVMLHIKHPQIRQGITPLTHY